MPDLRLVIAGLPKGLCGVVFRHDGVPGRLGLAQDVARLCRARRMPMVVAGGQRIAGAGVHLRGGRGRRGWGREWGAGLVTSSAHGRAELVRAARAGADAVFLSPAFATASHPEAAPLGVVRWAGLARRFPGPVFALGGLSGATARSLPRTAAGAGAIGALLP